MGSRVEIVKSVKYFNEIELLNKSFSNHQNYSADNLNEKIKIRIFSKKL